jgi:hypothetical protein
LVQSYIETLQHRSQYPLTATHPTPPKPTKPFVLGYSVIAVVLLFSVPGKACLAVCSVVLVASPKLKARRLIEEWLKSIIGYGRMDSREVERSV